MKLFHSLRFVGIVGWVLALFSSLAAAAEQEVNLQGDAEPSYWALAEKLKEDYSTLDLQDAVDIAVLLEAASKNSDTMTLVERFREVKENAPSEEEEEEIPTQAEMAQKLEAVFEEMKQLEKQWKDPAKAVEDLYAEGKGKSGDWIDPRIVFFVVTSCLTILPVISHG